ncbi:NUDIX domain-containing protein [Deinococcus sp. KNUC1210]|uniref:NUDIX domain-containing protein n=1 Tax=Deinococcus sp. KNUC1210 TaxID=2917691 RepID=UPI001EF0A2A2|nr:NUDIX domain-containing protein [Deinococcus sp. KNUC1210]ULH15136.1 NUDIX domain-containing protein [Deinococcus sp. KNUC1210]
MSAAEAPPAPPRPLVCVGALVRGPHDTYLIARTTKWRGSWGVPGGKVEWGETLEAATVREFREEVALELHDLSYVQTQEAVLSPEFHKPAHMLLIDFLARTDSEQVTPNEEIEEWAWVTLEAALSYPLNSYTRTLIERARELEA